MNRAATPLGSVGCRCEIAADEAPFSVNVGDHHNSFELYHDKHLQESFKHVNAEIKTLTSSGIHAGYVL